MKVAETARGEWRKNEAFVTPRQDFNAIHRCLGTGHRAARKGRQYAETLSFFGSSRACSIDFGQYPPMFRLDAARYRNAML
jgi:hypothetical protein